MRLILLVTVLGLLAASALLGLIYGPAGYAQIAELSHIAYFESAGPSYLPLDISLAAYAQFRIGILVALAISLVSTFFLLLRPSFQREGKRLLQELRRALSALSRTIAALSAAELWLAGLLLLALVGAPLVQLLIDSLSPDELLSYDAFVHQGPVATTGFYPIPNNHVLYNLLCWPLKQVMPGHVRAIMRLPSFLMATVGTAVSYLLLTYFRSFRVATVVTALFGLSEITVTYAASGRGYYLQFVCLELAFFAVLTLVSRSRGRRLAWAAFIVGCPAGLYAVPTFAMPMLALLLVLLAAGATAPARLRKPFLLQVGGAALAIGLISALLYWPVGSLSGWSRLLENRYLASCSLAEFLHREQSYLYEAANLLYGPPRAALLLWAGIMVVTPLMLVRPGLNSSTRWLASTCWVLLAVPAALMVVKQLFIPARALLFTTYFLYLLVALAADYGWRHWPRPWATRAVASTLAAVILIKLFALSKHLPVLLRSREKTESIARAYQWLRRQPTGPVFTEDHYHGLLFYHFNLLEPTPLLLQYEHHPTTSPRYVVLPKGQPINPIEWAASLPLQVRYQDDIVTIYTSPNFKTTPAKLVP
ncbi:hypothetical protein IC235_10940 [Hymenobacter sp. BT664]|uniref:Glycosyltransferase RgtA/B/C/D-like domain-containing protein n=1 Tax=Hymenobacter montanus TaxID=2771359 RepID=A0A927BE32_9BACT|nr:hypothetical protein [Hymenobacter montanus]MBD2768408.1 hypothetical protein [Hymenobacter montanus]